MGIRRVSLGESGPIRQVFTQFLCEELQDPDSGDTRRDRLSGADRARRATVYCASADESPFKAGAISRRRPLDFEAAEQPVLVRYRHRLARPIHKESARRRRCAADPIERRLLFIVLKSAWVNNRSE